MSTEPVLRETASNRPRGGLLALFLTLNIVFYSVIMGVFIFLGPVYTRDYIVTINGAAAMGTAVLLLALLLKLFPSVWAYGKESLIKGRTSLWRILAGFAAAVGLPILYELLVKDSTAPFESFFSVLEGTAFFGYSVSEILLHLLVIGLLVPVTEELTFRGILQRYLTERYHFLVGIIFTSVLFGIMHPDPVSGIVKGFAFGIGYGLSGSLWLVIGAHMVWNVFLAL